MLQASILKKHLHYNLPNESPYRQWLWYTGGNQEFKPGNKIVNLPDTRNNILLFVFYIFIYYCFPLLYTQGKKRKLRQLKRKPRINMKAHGKVRFFIVLKLGS